MIWEPYAYLMLVQENYILLDYIMNHKVYIDILKPSLHFSGHSIELSTDFTFMQDTDPKFTPLNTRPWLLYNICSIQKKVKHFFDSCLGITPFFLVL